MLDKTTLGLLARHALTAGGALLVSNGLVTDGQAQDAIGALIALAGIGWSIYQKRHQKAAIAAASTLALS